MKLLKVGSIIKNECKKQRINIMWDGECLCDTKGNHIDDGQADTFEKAQQLAPKLWCYPGWEYAPACHYNSLGILVLENRPRYIRK